MRISGWCYHLPWLDLGVEGEKLLVSPTEGQALEILEKLFF